MRDIMTITAPVRVILDERNTIEMRPGQHRQATPALREALLAADAASDDWHAKVNGDNEHRPLVEISGLSLDELSTDRDGFRLCFLSRRASVKYHTPGKPAGFGAFEDHARFRPNRAVWLSPEVFKLAKKAGIAHLAPIGCGSSYHYFSDATSQPHVDLGWSTLPPTKQTGDNTDDDTNSVEKGTANVDQDTLTANHPDWHGVN